MKSRRLMGVLLLLITSFLWGAAFVAQRLGSDHVGTFTFNASRFLLSSVVLGIVYIIMLITNKGKKKKLNKKQIIMVIAVGLSLFVGSSFLQKGIEISGSASKAAFISSLYIIFVPIFGLAFKRKTSLFIIPSLILALVGTAFVSLTSDFTLSIGDLVTFCATIGFTFQIILLSVLGDAIESVRLCLYEFIIVGVLSLICMFIFESDQLSEFDQAIPAILYSALVSGCIGYLFQIIGQKFVNETVASLILSLESVFGLLSGLILLDEQLTLFQWIGCLLILISVILSQINWNNVFNRRTKNVK